MAVSKKGSMPLCDYLPERMPHAIRRRRVSVTDFGGLTAMGSRSGETLADTVNLSARHAPALATRAPRMLFSYMRGGGTPHGMAEFGGMLYFAQGTTLYRTKDGVSLTSLGTVSDTDKQFFVFGDRLYIYPDKLYLEGDGTMPRPVELDTGVVEQAEFAGDRITLPTGMSWALLGFGAGDGLYVVNADDDTPAPEGHYRIKRVNGRVATLTQSFAADYVSNAGFRRVVPALDRYCVSGDRVYGILGKDVYISAAGSALDWYSRMDSDGSGPVCLHTDTEGDFTACMPWQGYVVFFKGDRICKLLGTRADTFALHDNRGAGIPRHLTDTLCEVDGGLCYASDNGVYRYRGQEPERIGSMGTAPVTKGCGGTDGVAYYLALESEGAWRQYVYRPDLGCWHAEDDLHPICMKQKDGFLRVQDAEGYIWTVSSEGRGLTGAMDERQVKGELVSAVTFGPDHSFEPDGYRLTALFIRATAGATGRLEVLGSYADGRVPDDGGEFSPLATFEGGMKDRLLRIPLIPRLCDGMTLKLVMQGEWVIHAVIREYEVADTRL